MVILSPEMVSDHYVVYFKECNVTCHLSFTTQ